MLLAGELRTTYAGGATPRWWKGNLHMHTLWTDGTAFPTVAAQHYKSLGYDFIAVTDHDMLWRNDGVAQLRSYVSPLIEADAIPQALVNSFFPIEHDGLVWRALQGTAATRALDAYREAFGGAWLEVRPHDGVDLARLQPFAEVSARLEEPGRFLMIQGVELTGITPLHFGAVHVADFVPPAVPREDGTTTAVELMQEMAGQIEAHRAAYHLPTLCILNHPNFRGCVTAEDILALPELRFFEVFNGHRAVLNEGDALRADTDAIWDIVLSHRAAAGNPVPLYGIAADDAHDYQDVANQTSSPGRGWVMVRSEFLTAGRLLRAMEAGQFYASTGVTLDAISFDGETLTVSVAAEPGVSYTIEFIGTRKGTPLEGIPRIGPDGEPMIRPKVFPQNFAASWAFDPENDPWAVTYTYDSGVGAVLDAVEGTMASFTLTGDEWYVRARVRSDKPHPNPYAPGDVEVAWVQPVSPLWL